MTTTDDETDPNLRRLNENMAKIEELSQRLVAAIGKRDPINPSLGGPDPSLWTEAAQSYWQTWMQDPAKMWQHQVSYWGNSVRHYLEAQKMFAQGKLAAPEDPGPVDRRFQNPLWQTHPYFNFIKRQYLTAAEAMRAAVADLDDMDPMEKRRLRYFTDQIADLMAPTNFLGTNPDALERAVETDGASLLKGLENLVADIEANKGELLVRLADEDAFEVGRNIATTPGKVVYRNKMMELIQFTPTTEKVHATPIVIFPPWINKYYILDLKEKNSFIKWVVDQGYTLFVVSWVNPDPAYADVSMDDYIRDGYLEAIEHVKRITGEKQINAVGYCIAGTTLALTLAYLKQQKDRSIKSATFFTALTDFGDQGEFTPFLQDDFYHGIGDEVKEHGILRSVIMARTFSFLRSNDLIYTPAIKSYMMGEAPPAFDLLYWNGDGANLPACMVMQYLDDLCRENTFVGEGMEILGTRVHVKDVSVPVISIACETDHIAAWRSVYAGLQQFGSKDRTFILSESGHIAGIVNPPSKVKYGHYTNDDLTLDQDAWQAGADFHEGSWWPRWEAWIKPRSGKQVPARMPGDADHPVLEDAPGSYVKVKAADAA
ncbi:PHA/PHB synthase family protein [Pseudaestuariivita atlantica]|uniref:Poly(R)-hydroxyalkanoic acid synthase n=1 Tax=Pseudaestuariivita atlantica TaxID=1317121 RepID=A0A0L1JU72_9RHOB|nr:class I poly(R)-hydroxyalkanoic acid synthase [Pseudaestuariivita atlantica]KNG95329.1 poly(R)-hydroxyalkanoic acid synthase [Pseudaestuariivita atlantica]